MRLRWVMAALCLLGGVVVAAPPVGAAELRKPQVVIGVPGRDVNGLKDAGAVEVRLATGRVQVLTAAGAQAGARFGTAVAMPDLNDDRIDDLVVGAPGYDRSGIANSGAVYVYLGTGSAFTHFRTLLPGTGVASAPQANSGFGSALSGEGDRFLIGIPGYDVRGLVDAGAAVTVWGAIGGTPPKLQLPNGLILADYWEEPEESKAGDRFGATLAETKDALLVGVPDADVGTAVDASHVEVLPDAGGAQVLDQNSVDPVTGRPLYGDAEAGDHFVRR